MATLTKSQTASTLIALMESLPTDMLQAYREGVAERYVRRLAELPADTIIVLINGSTLNGVLSSALFNQAVSNTCSNQWMTFELTGNIVEKMDGVKAMLPKDVAYCCVLLDIDFSVDILAKLNNAQHVLWLCSNRADSSETKKTVIDEITVDLLIDNRDSVGQKAYIFFEFLDNIVISEPELGYSKEALAMLINLTNTLSDSTATVLFDEGEESVTKNWGSALNNWFDLSPNSHSRLRNFVASPDRKTLFSFIDEGERIQATRYYVSEETIRNKTVIKNWKVLGDHETSYRVAVIFHSDKLVSVYNRLLNFYNGEAEFAVIISLTSSGEVNLSIKARPGMDAMDLAKRFNGKGSRAEASAVISFSRLAELMSDVTTFN